METWATYLGGLSAFAGVVFAVMLAARTISNKTRDHSVYLLWDSLAVTYELAAAALLATLFTVRAHWLASTGGILVALAGLGLSAKYLQGATRVKSEHKTLFDRILIRLTLLPMAAYICSAIYLCLPSLPVELLAFSVTWLTFSGTGQALIWFYRTWEHPKTTHIHGRRATTRPHARFPFENFALHNSWVATSYGALDISKVGSASGADLDCVVLPTQPSEPIGLKGDVAALWRRLVAEAVPDSDLSPAQRTMAREFEECGLASTNPDHPARTRTLPAPWLSSPLNELVYSLVAHLARERSIAAIFIKGPALHRQGLRKRDDSGDVDVWLGSANVDILRIALAEWGWTVAPTLSSKRPLGHAITLLPETWGCEIDLHYAFPGIAISGDDAFAVLTRDAEPVTYAGAAAFVPAREIHAVIAALSIARPQLNIPTSHPDAAADPLRRAGTAAMDAARHLRADAALAPALAAAFADFAPPAYRPPVNWR